MCKYSHRKYFFDNKIDRKTKNSSYFATQNPTLMKPIVSDGYSIYFGDEGYGQLSVYVAERNYSGIFLIADTNSAELCLSGFLSRFAVEKPIEIIEIEQGESMKNISTCAELWNTLTELGADRKSLIINLGGGVITDLGGFVASTFKRGIDFINVPTTLLGMVDAAIGGKNGVDLQHLKNQVGTITPPKMVLIDSSYLQTLPQNEMRSGLAEMLKHGLIADKHYWDHFLDLDNYDFADFDALIYGSVKIKNDIVMQDPTENGIRKALNFGHTLGHAIESHFLNEPDRESLLHGEAVAAGMVLESYISYRKNLISKAEYSIIRNTVKNIFPTIIFEENDVNCILSLLKHDKKNEYGNIRFALIDGIGKIIIDQDAENDVIIDAFDDYKL